MPAASGRNAEGQNNIDFLNQSSYRVNMFKFEGIAVDPEVVSNITNFSEGIHECYIYYDGPLVYKFINKAGIPMLAWEIDSSEPEETPGLRYVVTLFPEPIADDVLSGKIFARDFLLNSDPVWLIDILWPRNSETVEIIEAWKIDSSQLPLDCLPLPEVTLLPFTRGFDEK